MFLTSIIISDAVEIQAECIVQTAVGFLENILDLYSYSTAAFVQLQYSCMCTANIQLHMQSYSTAAYVHLQYSCMCTTIVVQLHKYSYSTAVCVQLQYSCMCTTIVVQLHVYSYSKASKKLVNKVTYWYIEIIFSLLYKSTFFFYSNPKLMKTKVVHIRDIF